MKRETVPGGIGASVTRPDALDKARGLLPYVDDLSVAGMLHAVVIRSPHAHAQLLSLDCSALVGMAGVHAVLGGEDLPGAPTYGPQYTDRPVLAVEVVRHIGEPVAVVVAADRRTAACAAELVMVRYRPRPAVRDVAEATTGAHVHPAGNVLRELTVRRDCEFALADWSRAPAPVAGAVVVVEGEYTFGRRPCPCGPIAVLATPAGDAVELTTTSTWLQADRDMIAQCLDLTPDQLRLRPALAAGAPDGELTGPVLAAMLARRLARPVRLVDPGVRTAPGAGPALRLRYRHHASADGSLVCVQARLLVDAGAYAGNSGPDLARLCATSAGPYRVSAVEVAAVALHTNNPPTWPLRGSGAAPTCVAVEAQLDELGRRLGIDPLLIRERNHLEVTDPLPTGQLVDQGSPGAALLTSVVDAPLPGRRRAGRGASTGGAVRRGVGHALGMTPLLIGEGVENPASATVSYQAGAATIRCAGAELGQGFVTVAMQIVREVLGVESISLTAADSDAPSAGPAECGRLTWVAGGAVHAAAVAIADELCNRAGAAQGVSAALLTIGGGRIRSYDGLLDLALTDVAGSQVIERTAKFSPPATEALDPTGQGVAFAGFGFAAHRAVVEVDVELGLVELVELVAAVDVGRVVNLTQLLAAVDGGSTAGVAMALGADVAEPTRRGPVADLRTSDLPGTRVADLLEVGQDGSWLGVKGVWDTPVGSAAAAVLAAVRDATDAAVTAIPVRPWHLVDLTGDQIGAGSR